MRKDLLLKRSIDTLERSPPPAQSSKFSPAQPAGILHVSIYTQQAREEREREKKKERETCVCVYTILWRIIQSITHNMAISFSYTFHFYS